MISGSVAEQVRRSTVQVGAGGRSAGSGVVLSRGVAVTNAHVVRGSSRAEVRLWDGSLVEARVEKRDERRDLALLRLPVQEHTPAVLRASAARPGELAVAVGSPLGFIGAVSVGVVRGVGPVAAAGGGEWIHADVRLAPGNSGGPLADAHGEVLGINTMICNGVGLAVPAAVVQRFVSAKAPFHLGVTVRPVRLAEGKRAVMVLDVETGGAAERASLLAGDLLIGVDGAPVQSVDDLADALERAGKRLSIRFQRGGGAIRETTGAAA